MALAQSLLMLVRILRMDALSPMETINLSFKVMKKIVRDFIS
jgi:hypothetical protein